MIRILIIDDMLFMRELLARSIKAAFPGTELDIAVNGTEAKRKMELNPYDLVLCDWELPDIKGNELLQWLRQHPVFGGTAFIMVTARNEKESIIEAKELGADDYIVKPLTIDVLSKKIREALIRRKKRA